MSISFAKYFIITLLSVGFGHASCTLSVNKSGEYKITSISDLKQIGHSCSFSAVYRQTADLISNGAMSRWIPIGASNAPFSGTYHGGGHQILGIYIDSASNANIGLFAYTDYSSIIDSLFLQINVTGYSTVGGLVGTNNGLIKSVGVSGDVHAKISTSVSYVGGIAGINNGTISSSFSTTMQSGGDVVGGIAGQNTGLIDKCYTRGPVRWNLYGGGGSAIGGVVGYNYGIIKSSYANGLVVYGNAQVGGLVGTNAGTIMNSYAIDSVKAISNVLVGGLVGMNSGGKVVYSYWDINTNAVRKPHFI